MKTNQVMTRPMGQFTVEQRTKDGMFNATALLKQWNSSSKSDRKMELYFNSPKTQEFIKTIMERENLHTPKTVYVKSKASRGANAGTWMAPVLFIDFAMWINPSFKYDVIKFVFDKMIEYRNEAGDAYKELCASISKIVGKSFLRAAISNIAKAINWVVFNNHEPMIRNKEGIEGKMKELFSAEKTIAILINDGFLCSYDGVIDYLRKKWSEKWTPTELTVKQAV